MLGQVPKFSDKAMYIFGSMIYQCRQHPGYIAAAHEIVRFHMGSRTPCFTSTGISAIAPRMWFAVARVFERKMATVLASDQRCDQLCNAGPAV